MKKSKSAFVAAFRAFKAQISTNYKEHIQKEYKKLFPNKK